jgi:ABC-type antimicrobial peptide transport system permease subunit
VLASTGTLRDERDELYDLETQGVPPSTLRNQLRLRAVALGTVGALGGIALGAVLALSTIGLVALTAGVSSPRPSLVLDIGWTPALLAAVAGAIAAAVAVVATTTLAFREVVPRRAGGAAP